MPYRTAADYARAADHHLALSLAAQDIDTAQEQARKARTLIALMWEATARENGWN